MTIPKATTPYIGISVEDVTEDWASDLNLSTAEGAVVTEVQLNSPAYQGGVRQYDVITAVNGESVANADELTSKVQEAKVGDKLKLTVVRGGAKQELTVTAGSKPEEAN
ncbi:PDZ domain-containing protein [Paenibacillus sp. P25]|nr:PDZ domain-containing protein [Paenibacillus sp. P25]